MVLSSAHVVGALPLVGGDTLSVGGDGNTAPVPSRRLLLGNPGPHGASSSGGISPWPPRPAVHNAGRLDDGAPPPGAPEADGRFKPPSRGVVREFRVCGALSERRVPPPSGASALIWVQRMSSRFIVSTIDRPVRLMRAKVGCGFSDGMVLGFRVKRLLADERARNPSGSPHKRSRRLEAANA
jgi:hypothetical protein